MKLQSAKCHDVLAIVCHECDVLGDNVGMHQDITLDLLWA